MSSLRDQIARIIVEADGDDPDELNEKTGAFGYAYEAADAILALLDVRDESP